MRCVTNGDLKNRDRMWQYTTGEYYQEMSLFIEETDMKEKAYEKAMSKKKK